MLRKGGAAVIDRRSRACRARDRGREAARGLKRLHRRPQTATDPAASTSRSKASRRRCASSMRASVIEVELPLAGDFQVENALVAAGLAIATGSDPRRRSSPRWKISKARRAGWNSSAQRNGAPIFVDYAHKPDALEKVLEALRPYAKRPARRRVRLRRRPRPGQAADDGRDRRARWPTASSSPTTIRAAKIRQRSAPRSSRPRPARVEIGDRGEAIRAAHRRLAAGRCAVIAGKGHESGQIVGDRVLPFSDHEAVAAALEEKAHERAALDHRRRWPQPMRRAARRARCRQRSPGISIDSRTLEPGDAFFAHQGRHARRP